MSTDWHYAIDLPLKADVPHDGAWMLDQPAFRYADIWRSVRNPFFGVGFTYEGRDYSDIQGINVVDGRLQVGAWVSNLERPLYEDDGILVHAERTRMEVFFEFLSRITTALPGDVVGTICSEHDDMDHAHPIVVCADGIIRRVYTEPDMQTEGYGYFGVREEIAPEALIPVRNRIPVEAIERDGKHTSLSLDVLRQLLQVELTSVDTSQARLIR